MEQLFKNTLEIRIQKSTLFVGMPANRLFLLSGLCASRGEASRLIQGGGACVNDKFLYDENAIISLGDMIDGSIKLSAGSKRHALVKIA